MSTPLLFNTLLDAVTWMRHLQLQMHPGASRALRESVKEAERVVDELCALHNLPPMVPELPGPHLVGELRPPIPDVPELPPLPPTGEGK